MITLISSKTPKNPWSSAILNWTAATPAPIGLPCRSLGARPALRRLANAGLVCAALMAGCAASPAAAPVASASDGAATDAGAALQSDGQAASCDGNPSAAAPDSGFSCDTPTDQAPAGDGAEVADVLVSVAVDASELDAAQAGMTGETVGADAADGQPSADGPTGDAVTATDSVLPLGPVWDLAAIADIPAAQCAFTDQQTVFEQGQSVQAYKLSFQAFEYKDGGLKSIKIAAFAARPTGTAKLPGIVLAHGLGGMAQEKNATDLAARLGMFVIAYTGPGGGDKATTTSQGDAASFAKGYKMFDVNADVRGSWFWGHAVAAMRATTCLTTRPDVDATKLGITGFSAGGVVSLLVAGHDPRVSAAVPMSGTLAWAKATEAPKAWQHNLLKEAGLTIASKEWQKLQSELIDPAVALAQAKAKVLMLNGTTDEFFPLTAHLATWQMLPAGEHRTSLAANFDHGCYGISGVESKQTIEDRAKLRADGGQKMWFSHWFATDSNFSYLPKPPQVTVQGVGAATLIGATIDVGGGKLLVDNVQFWASGDDAYVFVGTTLECKGNVCSKLAPVALPPNAVYFADVQYRTKQLLPAKFSVSSLPVVPTGLIPKIRGIDNCL